jgi:hypothetical protein
MLGHSCAQYTVTNHQYDSDTELNHHWRINGKDHTVFPVRIGSEFGHIKSDI